MIFSSNKKTFLSTAQQAGDAGRMLDSISPLVKTMYHNRALFAIHSGLNQVTVIFFYLLGLASFAFSLIMNTIFPFHILGEIISKRVYEDAMTNKGELETFNLAVKALVVVIGCLFIVIGVLISKSGKRNAMLQQSGKTLKSVEDYFLQIQKSYSIEEGQTAIEPAQSV